ncbi:hypothetical protein IWW37_002337 [Coemansia sp. RSA 2050]|nr:hypothetical protein IWW37_002337 [Coemansia sp. RSA 2050]
MNNPAYFKLVEPYVQRAQETSGVDPVVSYFCKYYAARLAITSGNSAAGGGSGGSSGSGDAFLSRLLDELEAEKQKIGDSDSMRNDGAASAHVLAFALRVFARADTEDREGRGTKATAKTFIIASQFLQVLASFGALEAGVAEKIKYAKWRATEILKAAREGRAASPPAAAAAAAADDNDALGWPSPPPPPPPPAPLPPASPPAPPVSYSAPPVSYSAPPVSYSAPPVSYSDPSAVSPPPAHSTFALPVSASPAFIPVPAANLPPPAAAAAAASMEEPPVDPDQLLDPAVAKKAQKLARWAISALEYDDVNNAIDNLREAIQVLLPFKK